MQFPCMHSSCTHKNLHWFLRMQPGYMQRASTGSLQHSYWKVMVNEDIFSFSLNRVSIQTNSVCYIRSTDVLSPEALWEVPVLLQVFLHWFLQGALLSVLGQSLKNTILHLAPWPPPPHAQPLPGHTYKKMWVVNAPCSFQTVIDLYGAME